MVTPIDPSLFPAFIYGVHDIGGQWPMLKAKRMGWLLDSVDLSAQTGTDYTRLASAGLGVLVRLNSSLTSGTIPPSDQYDAFAAQCASYVGNSPGARVWIIGNEMNNEAERPVLPDNSRETITPELYALCFFKCRDAIKNIPGHADDLVFIGAPAPCNTDTGDWVRYLTDILVLLDSEVDGITLHCRTHDFRVEQITSDVVADPPHNQYHCDFRTYRDFLNAIPPPFRSLPVLITEAMPTEGWGNANIGWIQSAYREIAEWNSDPTHQAVQALVLYRWQATAYSPQWSIQEKLELQDDLASAFEEGYHVRWSPPEAAPVEPPDAPIEEAKPAPAPQEIVPPPKKPWLAQFLAQDTPVSMVGGQTVVVNLRVKNVGARDWQTSGATAVHLGYRWFNARGEQQVDLEDRRTAIPEPVVADGEIALGAWLIAPKTPGNYNCRWDLVAPGNEWFANAGSPEFAVPIQVTSVPQDVTGWRLESSDAVEQVARALDGDSVSFWASPGPQKPGQWFRLNLAAARLVDGIQFLSPGKNFPAGYVLRVSPDGAAWTEIARVPSDNSYDVMAIFAPMQIQYAQIDLIAPSPTQSPWMISEILVHPANQWTANASHNARAAIRAIDNRSEMAWTSGAPQVPGMWFQLDLGREETVSGMELIAPVNEHPVGFRITVWQARANRWQVVCERTNNVYPIDVSFPAERTQFINIQLTQASKLPWAIQHVRVAREMESWLGPSQL
jgi:hypothetical protein